MSDALQLRLRSHLLTLAEPRNPVRHREAHLAARAYLKGVLAEQGREVEEQPFATPHDGQGVNLLGRGHGSKLLVAHYDTVNDSPGADDNTSAVAVALEVARRCPEVSILLPDLEEAGLLGARHFIFELAKPYALTVVLESVGYYSDEPQSQSAPPFVQLAFPHVQAQLQERKFRGDFLALLHLQQDTKTAQKLERALQLSTIRVDIPQAALRGPGAEHLADLGRSDHLAFWDQGHCCVALTDTANFRNPNYHRSTDTFNTLDFPRMAALVEGLTAFFSGP